MREGRQPAWRRLGPRLAAAFVAVAVAAVAALAGLTLLATRGEVTALVERQRAGTADAAVAALEDAYEAAGSWERADLRAAQTLVAAAPATLEVFTPDGRRVSSPGLDMLNMMARMHGGAAGPFDPPRRHEVTVEGAAVGVAELRFPAGGLPGPERQLRDALARTVTLGALVAALLAAAAALLVTRRLTRPLARLRAAVGAVERGDPDARAPLRSEIAEVDDLARAFDRMAATLARRERRRRDLAADLAHELRTPVTILQGNLEELLEGSQAATPPRLSALHDEVLRLRRAVEDLETLAAAEAAELTLRRHPLDLAEVVTRTLDTLRPHAAAADLELVCDLDPVTVAGDATRLGQVATNLLTNAIKFTPPGGRITVYLTRDQRYARLRVADTGPGIPDDELPRIFDRFWRGRRAATSSGSGIGLAVAAELVRAHDGTITATSDPAGGAVLTVVLPAA